MALLVCQEAFDPSLSKCTHTKVCGWKITWVGKGARCLPRLLPCAVTSMRTSFLVRNVWFTPSWQAAILCCCFSSFVHKHRAAPVGVDSAVGNSGPVVKHLSSGGKPQQRARQEWWKVHSRIAEFLLAFIFRARNIPWHCLCWSN